MIVKTSPMDRLLLCYFNLLTICPKFILIPKLGKRNKKLLFNDLPGAIFMMADGWIDNFIVTLVMSKIPI